MQIAASTRGISVFLNNEKLPIENFKDYIDLYTEENVFTEVNENWEIGVGRFESEKFQQVSLVNSIATTKGGAHVDCVLSKLFPKKLLQVGQ